MRVVRTKGTDAGSVVEAPAETLAETPKVSVAGAEVSKVVVCEGTTTSVVDGSFEAAGANVSVAGTLGSNVVGDTGCKVSVVNTKGTDAGSVADIPAETSAEAPRVRVAGPEVPRVVV